MHLVPKTPTTKGPAELFSGDVHYDVIAAGVAPSRLRVYLVRFAPGAHTAWQNASRRYRLHSPGRLALARRTSHRLHGRILPCGNR